MQNSEIQTGLNRREMLLATLAGAVTAAIPRALPANPLHYTGTTTTAPPPIYIETSTTMPYFTTTTRPWQWDGKRWIEV